MDSLESFDPTVVSNCGLCGDVCEEGVVVGDGEEAPDDCAVMLGPVFVICGGSTSVSDSGNNVLRSIEDTRQGFSGVVEEIVDGLNGDGVVVEDSRW